MIRAILFKRELLDIEIEGKSIYYVCNELIECKDGKMLQMEGIQLNDYKKKIEAEKICREIADNLKRLNDLLGEENETED